MIRKNSSMKMSADCQEVVSEMHENQNPCLPVQSSAVSLLPLITQQRGLKVTPESRT